MSESTIATLIGVGVYLGLRLIDYLLPKGRHWIWIERWTRRDSDDDLPRPEDEKG